MKGWIVVAAALAVAATSAITIAVRRGPATPSYRLVKVERDNIVSVVSATGTLFAVKTVQVGTQVSGLIAKLLVDFNDKVREGQVIAQLDTTLLEPNRRDAEATLERAQADALQARLDLERLTALHDQGISAAADFDKARYNDAVARASVKSAEAALSRARQNLAYATITAPVSGIVIERDVDVGQTVAASLATPKLFVIANDLSEMQILAPVAESDIGQIREGQTARFTVKAYPERRFTGFVKQVRLQSTTDQNIVDYTVVISVKNPDGKLLPGMTATVEFVVATAEDVLTVANAALRFRPTQALQAQLRERLAQETSGGAEARAAGFPATGADPARGRIGGAGRTATGGGALFPGVSSMTWGNEGGESAPAAPTLLYFLDGRGNLAAIPVRTGITDGQSTEVSGPGLAEGLDVIAGTTQGGSASSTTSNPFQSSQGGPPPGPPPGGF